VTAVSTKPAGWGELLGHDAPLLALLCLGVWLNAADTLVTATLMPSVARDIGGYAVFAWGSAGYMLGAVVASASSGRLSERLGLRGGMAFAAAVYGVGCAVSALAPHISVFLLGRLVQGFGAGWIVGLCFVAVRSSFPETLWAQVFAAIAGVWGVATVLGPLVGGLFGGAGQWRWGFWAFAAQSVVFGVAAPLLLKPGRARDEAGGLATVQLLMLTAAVALIAVAGVLARPVTSILLVLGGIALLGLMLRLDRTAPRQLLPKAASNLATPTGLGLFMIFCLFAGTIVFSVFGPAVLQAVDGLTPLQAGYVIATESVGWTVMALLVSSVDAKHDGPLIRWGAGAIALGVAGLAFALPSSSVIPVVGAGLLLGCGFGLMWSFASRRILSSLPDSEGAIGSAALPTVQIIGNIIGAATAGVIANLVGLSHSYDRATALHAAPWLFGAFAPVAAVGWLAAVRLTGRDG
jgi:MFS family permease